PLQRLKVRDEAKVMAGAGIGRRRNRQHEQRDVQPPPILEFAPRLPDDVGRRQQTGVVAERIQRVDYPMFWRSLPGLKRIVRPGGIRTSLPVRGLRPIPRLRGFTWKTPNPRSSMR